MGVEDYITGNTREERRQGWNCCCVLHSGDGPETTPWVRIVGVYDITAEEAAEHYARERMGGVDCDEWDDCSVMYVAVDTSMERPCVYACQKELQARINVRFDTERVDLLHPTLTVTRRSDS